MIVYKKLSRRGVGRKAEGLNERGKEGGRKQTHTHTHTHTHTYAHTHSNSYPQNHFYTPLSHTNIHTHTHAHTRKAKQSNQIKAAREKKKGKGVIAMMIKS